MWYRLCAERKPILHLGRVLLKPHLSTEKDSKTLVLARFWVLFPRGKSTPPEAGQADSTAIPPKKTEQDFARPALFISCFKSKY